jgi:hypothetical protein
MKVRYDDFWILTCLRRRIELIFAAPLPLGETFGLETLGTRRVSPFFPLTFYREQETVVGDAQPYLTSSPLS